MCGIAGFWESGRNPTLDMTSAARRMTDAIAYRGPDDAGAWVDERRRVALAHRRLAIVDLSPDASQPMHSTSGRLVIVFNGEMYNYREVATALEQRGHAFRTQSDTEVILAAVEEWGLEAALQRFVGMFAFAIWDRDRNTLSLARDRLGIKPLFVSQHAGTILFGSELKALLAHSAFDAEIDPGAMVEYLRYRYVPAPRTIYRRTLKLLPGHTLVLEDPAAPLPPSRPFWSAIGSAVSALEDPWTGSDADAIEALDRLLHDAVRLHMVSDVPIGAFLSGGIDSSTVVAIMRAHTAQPVRTFSLGFHQASYDEAGDARRVAAHLGTDHTELYVGDDDVRAVVPKLAEMFDEPFADASQVPTYLVSRLARSAVTVSLSGDGGDELFGGYTRYQWVPRVWSRLGSLPGPVRRGSLTALRSLSPDAIDRAASSVASWLPALDVRMLGDKLHKLSAASGASSPELLYRAVASAHQSPEDLLQQHPVQPDHLLTVLEGLPALDITQRMMLADLVTYLPDDILTKLDRCSMAESLEARVPLLDHRVVEFAWRVPMGLKIRDGQGKWLLRQVLARYVPPDLFERPKMGFDIPIGAWLRGPLRDWASALLDRRRLADAGLFDPAAIARLFDAHVSGRRNHRDILWAVLMFELWRERWTRVPALG